MRALTLLFSLLLLIGCSENGGKPVYKIARDPLWYPLNLPGKEAEFLGFSDDLIVKIAALEGFNVELFPASWDSLSYGLKEDYYEGILSSLPKILNYAEEFTFSDPYLFLGPVLIVQNSASYAALSDLRGREVGVLVGNVGDMQLLEKDPSIIMRTYLSYPLALEALVEQNIDAVIMPSLMAYSYVRDLYRGELKVIGEPLSNEALRLLTLQKEYPELIEKFNRGLAQLKKEGTYDLLLKKWQLQ